MSKKKNKQQRTQIPEAFLQRLTTMFGVSLFREIEKTFVARPTTFRINTLKSPDHLTTLSPNHVNSLELYKRDLISALIQHGFKVKPVEWYGDAFVLLNKSKRELTELDMYIEGKIYIQSLASMVPPLVLNLKPGEKVLDLTAAPGSKTSQIAALMQREGELVANDNNKVRFFKLKHNLEMLGVISKDEVTNIKPHPRPLLEPSLEHTLRGNSRWIPDASESTSPPPSPYQRRGGIWSVRLRMEHGAVLCREYPEYFDKILLDAPCSAEARFVGTDPKTFGYWKERKIKEMAYKQWQLLMSAWSSLKPGGTLVYSTCTFAPEENEAQISKFLSRNPNARIVPIDLPIPRLPIVKKWKNTDIHPDVVKNALRIKPNTLIEGFFVVQIQKS